MTRSSRWRNSPTTWNRAHRAWIARQALRARPTELALIDLLAAVDGLTVLDLPSFGTFRPGAREARRILEMEG